MLVIQNISIKHKLVLITMLTCVVALLSAAAGFIVWEWTAFRRTMVRDLSTQAEMIAENCKAALAFQDAKDAEKTLSALHVQPSIVLGCIYTNKGKVFASYHRKDVDTRVPPPELQEGGYSFGDGFLTVFRRIILDSEPVGTVCLRSDLRPMYVMLKRNTCIIIAVLLFASLVAYLMSTKLQKVISSPILSLADVAKVISEKKDYSNRALKHSNDEVGSLIDAFNEMLEQVQQRDFELVDAKVKLEMRVRERTAELSTANEQLEREVAERRRAQIKLQQYIKQLNCLYGLSKLAVQPQISLDQIFQETTEMIRSAYRYPDITCVRITFNGIQYKTDNFKKTEISQHADIIVRGEKAGTVEIYCLEDRQENGEGLFLEEEEALLEAVCEKLGRIAELKQATDKLRLFRTLIDQSNDCIFILEPKWGRFLDVNDRACESLRYSRKELLEMSIKDVEEFPEGFSWQQQIEELKLKGDIIIQGRHKCKDGTRFFAETSLKLVKEEKEDYIIAVARDITARKQAEEALRESEERYRIQFEQTIDALFLADTQTGIILDCNRAAMELIGREKSEMVGQHQRILHPSEEWDGKFSKSFKQHITGETFVETKVIKKSGEIRDVAIRASTFDLKGKKVILAIFRDITERKRAEEKLRESEERFHIAAETSNDVVYEWDMQHSIQWFGKIDQMLGYGPGEFPRTMEAWADSIHPQDRERVMVAVQAHLDGRLPYVIEYRIRRKDGAYQWWAARGAAARTPDGHPVRWIGTITDITERKKVEESQKQLVAIIEATPDFVGFADAKDKHIIYINKAGHKMIGVDEDEDVTKLKIFDIHPEWTNKMFAEEILPAAVRDGTWEGECAFLNIRDRHEIPVLMVLSSHKASNGEVEVFSTISRDITERKRAEKRQAELLKEVESVNRELKDFAYVASHDLKAPLRGIKTLAEWLSADYADKLGEQGKEQMGLLLRRVERMHNLIEGILQYSRVGDRKSTRLNSSHTRLSRMPSSA